MSRLFDAGWVAGMTDDQADRLYQTDPTDLGDPSDRTDPTDHRSDPSDTADPSDLRPYFNQRYCVPSLTMNNVPFRASILFVRV